MCVCVLFAACILHIFSAVLCGRISGPRFPRDPVLYNPLRVLFRILRWLAQHPAPPPSIFFLQQMEVLGTRTWLDSFPRFSILLRYLSASFND